MQAKRKSIQQELDLDNGYITLETKKPKLKGAKYVRECYARKHLQLKNQQAQFWKLINEANDMMSDETSNSYMHGYQRRQCIYIYIMLVIGTSKHKLSLMRRRLKIFTTILWMLYNQRGNILQMIMTILHIR
jgi:hypothetical protein